MPNVDAGHFPTPAPKFHRPNAASETKKDSGLLFWDSYTHLGVLSAHKHTLW